MAHNDIGNQMNLKKFALSTIAIGVAGVALAHHLSVGLSYIIGTDIVSSIHVYLTQPGNFGAPAYLVADEEHEEDMQLAPGDSFTISTPASSSTITFDPSQFVDMAHATDEEVVAAVNSQVTRAVFESQNGYLLARGVVGGSSLTLDDGGNGTLGKLHFTPTTGTGANDVQLELSIPDPTLGLENRPYLVLVSTQAGSFVRQGQTIPLGLHVSLRKFLSATLAGQLPGFKGVLDGNGDGHATLPLASVPSILGGQTPSELYIAYLVFSPDLSTVDYVSNLFTVHVH